MISHQTPWILSSRVQHGIGGQMEVKEEEEVEEVLVLAHDMMWWSNKVQIKIEREREQHTNQSKRQNSVPVTLTWLLIYKAITNLSWAFNTFVSSQQIYDIKATKM